MTRLLSIDPGKHFLAYAIFEDSILADVSGFTAEEPGHMAAMIESRLCILGLDELVIEFPQIYPPRVQKGDPNDLLSLAMVVGFVVQTLHKTPHIELVSPKRWKGSVPKMVHNDRIKDRLAEDERSLITQSKVPTGKRHNLIDAVGIGLWRLGR